jgi:transposase
MNTFVIQRDRIKLERRRLQAGRMFEKKKTPYAVAKQFGVSTTAAYKWRDAWEADKKSGLLSKGHPGFPSQYTKDKKKQLKQLVLSKPSDHGYTTDFWTIDRIRAVAKKELGVTLATKQTWQTIIGLGFSVQKPERRAKERNEKTIVNWKLKEFPKLKKMGR